MSMTRSQLWKTLLSVVDVLATTFCLGGLAAMLTLYVTGACKPRAEQAVPPDVGVRQPRVEDTSP